MHISNDDRLQSCFNSATPPDVWSVTDCEEKGPTVTITAIEYDKPLVLCEVEVQSASTEHSTLRSHQKNFTNVAIDRPATSSSFAPLARAGAEFVNNYLALRHLMGNGDESSLATVQSTALILRETTFSCATDDACFSDRFMLSATCGAPVVADIECEDMKDPDACILDGEHQSAILSAECSTLSFTAITFTNSFEDGASSPSAAVAAVVLDGGGDYTFTNCKFSHNKAGGTNIVLG